MSDEQIRATLRLLGLDPDDAELVEALRGMEPFERARQTGQPVSAWAYAVAEGLPVELRVDPALLDALSTADRPRGDDESADDEEGSDTR